MKFKFKPGKNLDGFIVALRRHDAASEVNEEDDALEDDLSNTPMNYQDIIRDHFDIVEDSIADAKNVGDLTLDLADYLASSQKIEELINALKAAAGIDPAAPAATPTVTPTAATPSATAPTTAAAAAAGAPSAAPQDEVLDADTYDRIIEANRLLSRIKEFKREHEGQIPEHLKQEWLTKIAEPIQNLQEANDEASAQRLTESILDLHKNANLILKKLKPEDIEPGKIAKALYDTFNMFAKNQKESDDAIFCREVEKSIKFIKLNFGLTPEVYFDKFKKDTGESLQNVSANIKEYLDAYEEHPDRETLETMLDYTELLIEHMRYLESHYKNEKLFAIAGIMKVEEATDRDMAERLLDSTHATNDSGLTLSTASTFKVHPLTAEHPIAVVTTMSGTKFTLEKTTANSTVVRLMQPKEDARPNKNDLPSKALLEAAVKMIATFKQLNGDDAPIHISKDASKNPEAVEAVILYCKLMKYNYADHTTFFNGVNLDNKVKTLKKQLDNNLDYQAAVGINMQDNKDREKLRPHF